MRPLDPRLLRYASASRAFLALGSLLGLIRTGCIVAFSWLLSQIVVGAIAGEPLDRLMGQVVALGAVGLLRAVMIWLMEVASSRGAARVKSQLRRRLVEGLARLGPGWLAPRNKVDVVSTAGPALESLDGYFSLFLPQLILTAIATPVIVVVMFAQDVTSGIIVVVTLPLIPIFMILIGLATQTVQRQQWIVLSRLSSRFLDVVEGLATLKIFGRQNRQIDRIAGVTEDYRLETMKVLRMSFLSGFALELIGSLSVALVAVSIGLRLVDGHLGLGVGLFVLLLAPEAFLPVRQVGANYHAAADGIAAAEGVFEILDDADAAGPARTDAPATTVPAPAGIRFDEITIRYDDRVAVEAFSAEAAPGRLTALSGPSGVGKSSLFAAALGFVPHEGTITIGGAASGPGRLELIAWAGQGARLIEGTVASNVALGATHPDAAHLARALRLAAIDELLPQQPVSITGTGFSGGQAERLSIARAIYRALDRNCPVLLLDEPSAALDRRSEAALLDGLRQLAEEGRTVLVASHRPAVLDAADDVILVREASHAE